MERETEKIICNLFRDPAPIIFITGRHGRGKTDFSLLIAEILLKNGVVKKFASNIKVLDARGHDYAYITNLVALKEWLYPKHIHKLFILDEAGMNIDRRNPLGKLNKEIRYLGFLLRKFRGKLILVSQRSKDIESTFADTDIWLATFKKLSKTEALLISNVYPDPIHFYNIPKTSFDFDTYDIAPFTSEPSYADLEAETEDRKILYEWLEHGSMHKIAKARGLHAQQVKRIILKEVKAILQARMLEE